MMKYFKNSDGQVYAYEADGSQDDWILPGLVPMTDEEVDLHLNPPPTDEQIRFAAVAVEESWQKAELVAISNQLMAIEEAEAGEDVPDLLPGTRAQWLSYRTKIRAWKEGHVDFPDQTKRPIRPS